MIDIHWMLRVVVALVLALPTVPGTAETYRSEANGYTLEIPEGWRQIPAEVIEEMQAMMSVGAPQAIVYETGFQPDDGSEWLEYPYVLVQPVPYAKFGVNRQLRDEELKQVVATVTGMDLEEALNQNLSEEVAGQVGSTESQAPEFDAEGRRFVWRLGMEVADLGNVQGQTFGHFGRDALVQVAYYDLADPFAGSEAMRTALDASFKFDADRAYDPGQANGGGFSVGRVIRSAVLYGVLGAVVALVIGLIKKRRESAAAEA